MITSLTDLKVYDYPDYLNAVDSANPIFRARILDLLVGTGGTPKSPEGDFGRCRILALPFRSRGVQVIQPLNPLEGTLEGVESWLSPLGVGGREFFNS